MTRMSQSHILNVDKSIFVFSEMILQCSSLQQSYSNSKSMDPETDVTQSLVKMINYAILESRFFCQRTISGLLPDLVFGMAETNSFTGRYEIRATVAVLKNNSISLI